MFDPFWREEKVLWCPNTQLLGVTIFVQVFSASTATWIESKLDRGRGSRSSHWRVTWLLCRGHRGRGGAGGARAGNVSLISHLTAIVRTVVYRLLVHSIRNVTHTRTHSHKHNRLISPFVFTPLLFCRVRCHLIGQQRVDEWTGVSHKYTLTNAERSRILTELPPSPEPNIKLREIKTEAQSGCHSQTIAAFPQL